MRINGTLTQLVLAGTIVFFGSGCVTKKEYHFEGKIGEEQVKFYEPWWGLGNSNVLEVTREDGSKSTYIDSSKDNLEIDCVKMTVGDNTTRYCRISKDPEIVDVVERAQREFDAYLKKITETQTASLGR